jgi:ABC-type uncharacterized transport system fused permease/ATPase subunit
LNLSTLTFSHRMVNFWLKVWRFAWIELECSYFVLASCLDVSFSVKPGCNVMITGPNGAGKSSLFRYESLSSLYFLKNNKVS